jgi:predicted dehydrogenase
MTVALVGLGYWGAKLLRNLVSTVGPQRVVAADASASCREAALLAHPGLTVVAGLDEVLSRDDVDAVMVATPVSTHADLAERSLLAGRHVFVEKPLADDVAAARRLAELAERERLVLMVGHTFLFSPVVQRMISTIAAGGIGRVHYATSSRLNLGLYRSDANVIWDLAPHDFSILFRLLDEQPVSVQALARSLVRPGVPDVAFLTLSFPSGAVASVNISWLAPRRTRQLVVVGEDRMMSYDDSRAEEPFKIYDRGVVVPDSSSFAENRLTYRYGDTISPVLSLQEPLRTEVEHFLACAAGTAECLSDGRFGLSVVQALAAADASWRNGGDVVPVDDDPDGRADVVDLVAMPTQRQHAVSRFEEQAV